MQEQSAYEVFPSIKLVRVFYSGAYLGGGGRTRKIDHHAEIRYGRGKDIGLPQNISDCASCVHPSCFKL